MEQVPESRLDGSARVAACEFRLYAEPTDPSLINVDRIKPGIAGEDRTASSPGRQPGQGALVAAGCPYSAAASSFATGFSSRSWNFV